MTTMLLTTIALAAALTTAACITASQDASLETRNTDNMTLSTLSEAYDSGLSFRCQATRDFSERPVDRPAVTYDIYMSDGNIRENYPVQVTRADRTVKQGTEYVLITPATKKLQRWVEFADTPTDRLITVSGSSVAEDLTVLFLEYPFDSVACVPQSVPPGIFIAPEPS